MAKTTASLVLLVICMALFLNGYSAVEGARSGNQMKKHEARSNKYHVTTVDDPGFGFGLPKIGICLKLHKLCLLNPTKYCIPYIKKCKS